MPKKSAHTKTKEITTPERIHEDERGLERLVFFSDAVFAIAITLLALEIRLPATEEYLNDAQLYQALVMIWPEYLSYFISFLVIGTFWINHHRKFRSIRRYDSGLIMLNLLLMMTVAFIPFPTSVISEYGNQTATIFYALSVTMTSLFSASIWWYASYHDRLIDSHSDTHNWQRDFWSSLVTPAVFLLSIPLSLLNADLAKFSWLLAAVIPMIIR